MAANSTPILIEGYLAGAAVPIHAPITAAGLVSALGESCVGFTAAASPAGLRVPVVVNGSAVAVAGATISQGQTLQVGAGGTVIPKTTGTIVGRAMNSCAAGDFVEVLIDINFAESISVVTDANGNVTGLSVGDVRYPIGPQSARNFVGTRVLIGTGQGGFPQGGANYTWSLQTAIPTDFVAVRLIIGNNLTAAITGVTACASVGGTATDKTNNAGAFVNATFSGASSVTLPAATSTADPTYTTSDWINLQSIARVDGGTLPLLYVRCMTPLANANAPLIGLGLAITGWSTKSDGNIWAWRFQSGDYVTTPAGMSGSSDPSGAPIAGVQYLSKTGAVISVAAFGDSITSAYLATVPADSWLHKAVTAYGNGASILNFGWSAQNSSQYLVRAQRCIPLLKPTHAFYSVYTANDGAVTAATTAVQYSRALQFVDLCRQNGTVPILLSGLPQTTSAANTTSSLTVGQDDLRKQLNQSLMNIGVEVVDMAAAMSDQNSTGTASKWVSALVSVDGLHPNDTGNDLMATTALGLLNKFSA